MNEKQQVKLNSLIAGAYECRSFEDFLRLTITGLHQLVMYDSGLFFCAISRDSSYFHPYISGDVEDYYEKKRFEEREDFLETRVFAGEEAVVYYADEHRKGQISVPRRASP